MPRPTIEDRAYLAPAKCVISGAGDGPIINTGADYQDNRGRIYVSVPAIAHLLRDLGWVDPDEAKKRGTLIDDLKQEVDTQAERLAKLEPLAEAVQGIVEPEVVEKETVRTVIREPSPEDIRTFIEENPNSSLVQNLQRPDPGSIEEWRKLYGAKGPRSVAQRKADEQKRNRDIAHAQRAVDATSGPSEAKKDDTPEAPPSVVTLHGQDVDLDDLLDGRVKDVVSFIEGHPTEFQLSVLEREVWRNQKDGKEPRVTLVKAINDNVNIDLSEESDDE